MADMEKNFDVSTDALDKFAGLLVYGLTIPRNPKMLVVRAHSEFINAEPTDEERQNYKFHAWFPSFLPEASKAQGNDVFGKIGVIFSYSHYPREDGRYDNKKANLRFLDDLRREVLRAEAEEAEKIARGEVENPSWARILVEVNENESTLTAKLMQ